MPPTEAQPKYAPSEIFYTFLTTLHYDKSDHKLPPTNGWPSLSPALCEQYNLHLYESRLAIKVLGQIPYFRETKPITSIHYKSILLDWDAIGASKFTHRYGRLECSDDLYYDYFDLETPDNVSQAQKFALYEQEQERSYKVCNANMILLSKGHESGGRGIWLDVVHGRVWEDAIRCDMVGNWDLVEYLDMMRGLLVELKIVPAVGRICLEIAYRIPQRTEEEGQILLEDILQQGGFIGSSALDVQFVRQEYRRMGWPGAFRKEEAEVWVRMLDRACEGRMEMSWETEDWFL